jgi:hypothetical protein
MINSRLIPLLPIKPPILEYVDGVLTKDSLEILEKDVNWFTNYAQQYLLKLKTLSYEEGIQLGYETDWNKFHLKNESGVRYEE